MLDHLFPEQSQKYLLQSRFWYFPQSIVEDTENWSNHYTFEDTFSLTTKYFLT